MYAEYCYIALDVDKSNEAMEIGVSPDNSKMNSRSKSRRFILGVGFFKV